MAGGAVRKAAVKVSAARELLTGLALGIAGAMVWRSWHVSYKSGVDEFYKEYEAKLAKESSQ